MFLKLPFAVSYSVLIITIQYVVFRKSLRTFYVSLYIYIYIYALETQTLLSRAKN